MTSMEDESDTDSGEETASSDEEMQNREAGDDRPGQPLAFVVMTLVIGGYTLIGPLQHDLKSFLNIHDNGFQHEMFTQAVALIQWAKTLTTIGQNCCLFCVPTLTRVYIAIGMMFAGTLIPPLFIFLFGSRLLIWVIIAYSLIGLALGIFECTYLSVISPLGPRTKSWAIMGFPAAFGIINVIGGSLKALFDFPVQVLFWYIVLGMPIAAFALHTIAPKEEGNAAVKSHKQASICTSLVDWHAWVPRMVPFMLVNVVSHFTMESTLPAIFNTFNQKQVALFGPDNPGTLMDTKWYLVVLYVVMLVCDMSSRRVGYCFVFRTYLQSIAALVFSLCCCIGGLILLTWGVASISWLGIGISFFGAGFNYAVTARYIDKFIPREHNLASYSLWMFLGYSGAIAGACLVTLVQGWICNGTVESEYQCRARG